jgi:hypothetical protein
MPSSLEALLRFSTPSAPRNRGVRSHDVTSFLHQEGLSGRFTGKVMKLRRR